MSYRPPLKPPKGTWARHIHAQRRERGLSQMQAFELVREGLHFGPRSKASWDAIDMGKRQPREEEAEYLASVFGWPPEESEPEPSPDLATAIVGLTAELQAARKEREQTEVRLRYLEGAVEILARAAGVALPKRSVPDGTAG